MSSRNSLNSQFQWLRSLRPKQRERRPWREQSLFVEALESRTLLAGLVIQDSTFDIDQFWENMHEQLPTSLTGNGVVGYSFAINQTQFGPDLLRTGAGGKARLSWDTPQTPAPGLETVNASPTRDQEIASISKTITGAAILHLLQEQTSSIAALLARLDDPATDFLPGSWSPSANFSTITVRELLTHTSGLIARTATNPGTPGGITGGLVSPYTYAGLQQVAEQGTVFFATPANPQIDTTKNASYWTTNYAFFRVMLPYMWSDVNNAALDFNATTGLLFAPALSNDPTINQELIDAIEDDWNVGPSPILPSFYNITADRVTASIYKYYVSHYILEPAGIVNPQTKTDGPLPTLLYQSPPNGVAGVSTPDQTLNVGSRGWNLSASEVTKFLTAMQSDAILELGTRVVMNAQFLGWRQASTNTANWTGDFGRYLGHDGVNFRPQSIAGVAQPNMNNTIAMIFPNQVQASLLINSQIQSTPGGPVLIGAAFNPGGTGTNTTVTMRNAYDNAWTELVYDGDSLSIDGAGDIDDTFTLRLNPTDSDFLDFFHDGTLIFTRRIDTLKKLTINGFEGTNTYVIRSLPATLELVINGGSGSDLVGVGVANGLADLDTNTPGILRFNGGAGFDRLRISDTNDGDGGNVYTIRDDQVTRSGPFPLEYHYDNVSELFVNTTNFADEIWVESTQAFTNTTINAGNGSDTITVGTAHIDFIDGAIDINGGGQTDLVRFSDVFSGTPHDYRFRSDRLTLDNTTPIRYDVEMLELHAGLGNDTIIVQDLASGQDLEINAAAGADSIVVAPLGLLSAVAGSLSIDGGSNVFGQHDSLVFNDVAHAFDAVYTIENTSFRRSGLGKVADYFGIETLTLNTSSQANLIRVHGLLAGTRARLNAGSGDDRFVLGGQNASGNLHGTIEIQAGAGEDHLTIDDRNGIANHDFYIFQPDFFQSGFIPVIEWGLLSPPENITLIANDQDSTTNIRDVLDSVRLVVQGRGGDDEVNIHAAHPDAVVQINGGSGDDTIQLSPQDMDLNLLRGVLRVTGGLGDDDLVAAFDSNNPARLGRNYRVVNNTFDVIGSAFGKLVFPLPQAIDTVEVFEIHAGDRPDQFDVRSWSVPTALHMHGNGASDLLSVASVSHTLDSIVGPLRFFADVPILIGFPSPDEDRVVLHDENRAGTPNYDMMAGPGVSGEITTSDFNLVHHGAEQVTLNANSAGSSMGIGGVLSPTHRITYTINASGGNDVITVETPIQATVFANGGDGFDVLRVIGSAFDDVAALRGDVLEVGVFFQTVIVRDDEIERTHFDGGGGLDLLIGQGLGGVKERFRVQATPTSGSGSFRAQPFRPLTFSELEDVDVRGNADDGDELRFDGTDEDDFFAINLLAEGTAAQPVLTLNNENGGRLLRLRNYDEVGTPMIRGGRGADTFRVALFPGPAPIPIRDIRLDGGSSGGQAPGDTLIVDYDESELEFVDNSQGPPHAGWFRFITEDDEQIDLIFSHFEEVLGNVT